MSKVALKVGDKFQTKYTVEKGIVFTVEEVFPDSYKAIGPFGDEHWFSRDGVMIHYPETSRNVIDWSTVRPADGRQQATPEPEGFDDFLTWEAAS